MSHRIPFLPAAGLLAALAATVSVSAPAVRAQTTPAPTPPPLPDATFGDALPVAVKATDKSIRFDGRFDRRDPAGPRFSWSASGVALRFHGTDLNVVLSESANARDFWQTEVDGVPAPTAFRVAEGEHRYRVASGLADADHTVRLMKATEASQGVTQLLGFEIGKGGKLLAPPPAPKRGLEVIGDSISCGYGILGEHPTDRASAANENAYYTYGAVTARRFGAGYACIAWSGRKLWPNNTTPSLYDLSLARDPESIWDFKQFTPDAVLINLATNDFGRANPSEFGWTHAYSDFIGRIRTHYPKVMVYIALGPMVTDTYPRVRMVRSTVRGYLDKVLALRHEAGDDRVRIIDFGIQDAETGMGAAYHPNVKTNAQMADLWSAALTQDLGWQPAAAAVAAK